MQTLDLNDNYGNNTSNINCIIPMQSAKNSIANGGIIDLEILQHMMQSVAKEAAENAVRLYGGLNIDNFTADTFMSEKGEETDMAKRIKQRAIINKNEYWLTGETQQDIFNAYLKRAQEEGLLNQVQPTKNKDIPTLKEFVEKTYKPNFVDNLAPKTAENYTQYLNLNIIPFLGEYKINEITVANIQQFYDWMATASSRGRKKDINAKSIERISGFLGRIFRVALDMKLIDDHPIKKTLLRINAEPAGHHKALSDEEIKRVKAEIPFLKSRSQRLYMALLAFTGMRPEEVMGMKWNDIHLEAKKPYALIMRAVTYPDNSKPVVGPPKTPESARTVILPEKVVKILSEAKKDHGFICGDEKPWCYSNKARISNEAFKKLGIEDYSDYDFRTTYGTQLKEAGVSSAIIADLMGHTDTRMVERVYARTRHEGVMKQYDAVEMIS